MKKLILSVLCILVLSFSFMPGCTTTPERLDKETTIAIAEIVSRRAGAYIAQKNPYLVNTAVQYCETLLEQDQDDINAMLLHGLRFLSDKYTGDPLIADDLVSIIKLLGINLEVPEFSLDDEQFVLVKAMVKAFMVGLQSRPSYDFSEEARETDLELLN